MNGIAIHNVHLLDGFGGDFPNADVFIEDGDILDVRIPSAEVPNGWEIIDGSGCSLMPGLIDGHVHLTFDSSSKAPLYAVGKTREVILEQALVWARQHLQAGVTTVRELAGTVKGEFSIRDALSGYEDVPRIYDCIGTLTASDGFGLEVATALSKRNASSVIGNLAGRADHLKLLGDRYDEAMPGESVRHFDDETFAEICRAARQAELPVVVHAKAQETIRQCIEHGVHCIEHGITLGEDDLQQIAEAGIFYEATFWGLKNRADVQPGFDEFDRVRAFYTQAQRSGVRLTLGSDSGAVYTPHGGAPGELAFMVDAGLTSSEAITAATSTGAALVGNDLIGAVEAGRKADLLLLSADPLRDITAVSKSLLWVMKEGRIVHRPGGD